MPGAYLEITSPNDHSGQLISLLRSTYLAFAELQAIPTYPIFLMVRRGNTVNIEVESYGVGFTALEAYETLCHESGTHRYADQTVQVAVYRVPERNEFGVDTSEVRVYPRLKRNGHGGMTYWYATHQPTGVTGCGDISDLNFPKEGRAMAMMVLRTKLYHLHLHGDLPPTDLVRTYSEEGYVSHQGEAMHPHLRQSMETKLLPRLRGEDEAKRTPDN